MKTQFFNQTYDSRQSFYNKASIEEHEDGTIYLKSYNTYVAALHPKLGFITSGYYSMTTARHQLAFALYLNDTKNTNIDTSGTKSVFINRYYNPKIWRKNEKTIGCIPCM